MRLLVSFIILISAIPVAFSQADCDYKVEILPSGSVFDAENFTWRMKAIKIEGLATNITGTAQIEDLQYNLIKSYKPWTNDSISRQKTSGQYSPNLKPNEYKITAKIDVECNDIDKNNNVYVRLITIESTNPQSTKTQEVVANNINNSVDKNIEEKPVNTKSIDTIQTQNKTNENDLKIQAIPQNQDMAEDNFIHLKMQASDEKNNSITASAVKPQIAYESSNEKSKQLVLYSLLGLSILLNIILIWRR